MYVFFFITDCPPFQLHHGKFRTLNTTVFLYATSLSCNQGYELNGEAANFCEHGKWKNPLQTCTRELLMQYYIFCVTLNCFYTQICTFTHIYTTVKPHYRLCTDWISLASLLFLFFI